MSSVKTSYLFLMLHRIRYFMAELFTALVILTVFTTLTASAQWMDQQSISETPDVWELEQGDWIIVNVEHNVLQFVREDHSDVSQPIRAGSGINTGKTMYYLGMAYDPATPEKVWEIREKKQQGWWGVFGTHEAKEQLFFRLFEVKDDQRIWTHYGIHTTPEIETIFEEQDGFGSWGCVLTRYDLLKRIEELYELNEGVIKVVTTKQESNEVVSLLKAF